MLPTSEPEPPLEYNQELYDWVKKYFRPKTKDLRHVAQMVHDQLIVGVESFPIRNHEKLSEIMGGFRPGEFTILCGSTGAGKTTLCSNWSASFLVQKIPQLIMSVETGPVDYVTRMLSALDQNDYNGGEAITIEARDLLFKKWGTYLHEFFTYVGLYINRVPMKDLLYEIIEAANNGVKVVILDNLNYFLEVTSAQNQLIETDKVLHELIILTKSLNIHCIMIMHPKKTETGRVEDEFDIKGSSTAVQEAFNVLLFNRPSQRQIDAGVCDYSDRELKLVKSRHRGKHVGSSVIYGQKNSVFYYEKAKYTFLEMREKTKSESKTKRGFTE